MRTLLAAFLALFVTLEVQAVTISGTITNSAFGSAPYVVVSTIAEAAPTLHLVVTNVTATTFTAVGDAAGVYHWIAVGAP